jgi:hypothetical protein
MTRMICGIQIWAHNTRYNVLQIRGIRRDIKFCEEITRCRDIPSYCHKFHFFPIEKKKNVVRPIDWQWRSSNRSISLFTCDYNWSDRDCLGCQFGRSTDCYRHHFIVVWYYGFDNGALTSPDLFPSSPAITTHPIMITTMICLSSTVLGSNWWAICRPSEFRFSWFVCSHAIFCCFFTSTAFRPFDEAVAELAIIVEIFTCKNPEDRNRSVPRRTRETRKLVRTRETRRRREERVAELIDPLRSGNRWRIMLWSSQLRGANWWLKRGSRSTHSADRC